MSIQEIVESAKKDPSLFSTLDIETLLSSVEKEKHDYLENKTTSGIAQEIYQTLVELDIEQKEEICSKLLGYRYVEEIHELHKGKHIRWIRNNTQKLTTGGMVVNIKFLDTGTHIVVKNAQHRFIQYKFDDAATFQKMSTEEQLIVLAYEQCQLLLS
jgi:hypothetical protein